MAINRNRNQRQRVQPFRALAEGIRNFFGRIHDRRNPAIQTGRGSVNPQEARESQVAAAPTVTPNQPLQQNPTADVYRGTVTRDPKTGQIDIQAPNIAGAGTNAQVGLRGAAEQEITRANESLDQTRTDIAGRGAKTERDIQNGILAGNRTAQVAANVAAAGMARAENLPAQVKADVEGIANEYKQQTDVDIGHIESLGREAVGLAVQGKNAAAQAATEAQQQSTRNAIAQINADPNIPQSRKTAMIAQIQTQSSMQIASTVGANIKDFTAMQVGAMTSTMNAVASASTARNQSLAALGGAEISAVSGAHIEAAQLMKGYDDLRVSARQNADNLRFQYTNLAESARNLQDQDALALLDKDLYVGGMPYDFRMADWSMTQDVLGMDFQTQMQGIGMQATQDAMQQAARAGKFAALGAIGQTFGGPFGQILSGFGAFASAFAQ